MKGQLTIITGCMYGGKSLELIEQIKGLQYRELSYMAITPIREEIKSRGSNVTVAAEKIPAGMPYLIPYQAGVHVGKSGPLHTIVIDEVQFYSKQIIYSIQALLENGINVIAAGLDTDYTGKPFGAIGELMALANEVKKRYTVCMKCKERTATRTQRLDNGVPAPWDGPTVLVEGSSIRTTYEARCTECHTEGHPLEETVTPWVKLNELAVTPMKNTLLCNYEPEAQKWLQETEKAEPPVEPTSPPARPVTGHEEPSDFGNAIWSWMDFKRKKPEDQISEE